MDRIEKEMKHYETNINNFAEKVLVASNTIMVTKKELLQQLIDKELAKSKMLKIAGEVFNEYEKEIDETNQIIKSFENYIVDDENKNDVLNKVFESNIKEDTNFEKDAIYKNISSNRYIKLWKYDKRKMQLKNQTMK